MSRLTNSGWCPNTPPAPVPGGRAGGIQHFGLRFTDPGCIEAAVQAVEEAGGKIQSRGEFCPGEPYLFFSDPDGYEVEIWYEAERG